MTILITGGAGYIGSHTTLTLLENGFDVVVVDNLCNSHPEAIARVRRLAQKDFPFYQLDFGDRGEMSRLFEKHAFTGVIHFAGLKAVGESVAQPLAYYQTNVAKTLTLCELMQTHEVSNIVFSSSATVYGSTAIVPYTEDQQTGSTTNPYGRSKYMVEEVLKDLHAAQPNFWKVALLRYFNPIGAHSSGDIGEDPNGIPNNLLPYVAQVAAGKLAKLRIFGNDYDTPDGTGVRDYIHVMDLAQGHLLALKYLADSKQGLCEAINLGAGEGHSVMEVRDAFERISGRAIPYEVAERRHGDLACYYANADKANQLLGWRCKRSLDQMIEDTWRWQSGNPSGYR